VIHKPDNKIVEPWEEVQQIVKKSIKFGIHRNPRQAQYLRFLEINPNDTQLRQLANELINNEENVHLYNSDPFRATNPILVNQFVGNIGIGIVPPAMIHWLIDEVSLLNHLLVSGRSFGGKSSLVLLVLYQILLKKLAYIKIFDRKGDYACLTIFPDFHYWCFKDYFTNWLEPPPGINYRKWLSMLFELFANYLDIRIAGRNLLLNTALWLGRERNSESTRIYPTLRDVQNAIKNKKYPFQSHLARYQETVLNRVTGLIDQYGDQICSNRKLNWTKYLNSSWAISVEGLPTDMQNLVIAVTVGKILNHKMSTNQRIVL